MVVFSNPRAATDQPWGLGSKRQFCSWEEEEYVNSQVCCEDRLERCARPKQQVIGEW